MTERDAPTRDTDLTGSAHTEPGSESEWAGMRTIGDLLYDREFGTRMAAINTAIEDFTNGLDGEPPVLYEAARHLLTGCRETPAVTCSGPGMRGCGRKS